MSFDRAKFYAALRQRSSGVFGTKLSAPQVAGMETILDWALRLGTRRDNLSYGLATTYLETGRTMQPVRETFATSTAQAIARLDAAWKAGKLKWVKKPYWRGGWFGRGFSQLTHEFNYDGKIKAAVKAQFGVDIHADPDLVMRPDIAAFILLKGSEDGWFTGKGYDDYLDGLDESDAEDLREYTNARRIINGVDRAAEIGGFALAFEKALTAAGYPMQPEANKAAPEPAKPVSAPSAPAAPETPPEVAQPPRKGIPFRFIVGGLVLLAIVVALFIVRI